MRAFKREQAKNINKDVVLGGCTSLFYSFMLGGCAPPAVGSMRWADAVFLTHQFVRHKSITLLNMRFCCGL